MTPRAPEADFRLRRGRPLQARGHRPGAAAWAFLQKSVGLDHASISTASRTNQLNSRGRDLPLRGSQRDRAVLLFNFFHRAVGKETNAPARASGGKSPEIFEGMKSCLARIPKDVPVLAASERHADQPVERARPPREPLLTPHPLCRPARRCLETDSRRGEESRRRSSRWPESSRSDRRQRPDFRRTAWRHRRRAVFCIRSSDHRREAQDAPTCAPSYRLRCLCDQ